MSEPFFLGRLVVALALIALGIACPAVAGESGSELKEHLSFASPALGREMAYSVYLPPGFDAKTGRYPAIYLLHGVGDDDTVWPIEGKVQETADRLIAEGTLPPSLIVMPDAKTSWYVNSRDAGGPGDYDTAIDRDLVAMIDGVYHTRADRQGRAVIGISMGGFGALRFALRRPHRYAAVVAMSPALWLRVKPGVEIEEARTRRVFQGSFGNPFSVDRFLKATPVNEIAGLKDDPSRPRILFLVGDKETFSPPDARAFADMLSEVGAPAEFEVGSGNHNWVFWASELGPALGFVGQALAPR